MTVGRISDLSLLAVSAAGLAGGTVARVLGHSQWADAVWIAGSLPALAALIVAVGAAIARRSAGLDLIALMSTGGALALGEYATAAVIALMLASGRCLEDFAEERARREMSALLARAPRTANRYQGGGVAEIPLDRIAPGDRLLVRAGEAVPTDGTIAGGTAVLDESALTGEALPVRRGAGEPVASGCVNAAAPFDIIATTTAAHSTFAGITRLVEAAHRARAPSARLADRYALLFVPLAIALAAAAWIASRDPVRALAVLVVATPCPLILAVPVAIVAGMSRCARRGVLIKGGAVLERLAQARTLFFDKTGTLTAGLARLVDIETAPGFDPAEVLRAAAALDQVSQHVIAGAVVAAARERGLDLTMPTEANEKPGAGVSGRVGSQRVVVGSYEFVSEASAASEWTRPLLLRIAREGASGVFVAIDGVVAGVLLLIDEVRLDTPRALRLLRKAGIERIVMLTGDRRDVAETIGELLGIDQVLAEQQPGDKLAAVRTARGTGATIMVGDGINDAPALAAADVGVAMGARGAAASSEAAGVVMLVDRLDRLAEALTIAHRSRAIAMQSVIVGMGLSAAAMGVAGFGFLPPLAGAILQEAIDFGVILNALRVLRVRGPREGRPALTEAEYAALRREHDALRPVLDEVRRTADHLASLSRDRISSELAALTELLRQRLMPHETRDDAQIYPGVARLLGGDDPMAAMSRGHREILRLVRMLQRLTEDTRQKLPDEAAVAEILRLLHGLDAILRLHFAQEDEIYHSLAEVDERTRR